MTERSDDYWKGREDAYKEVAEVANDSWILWPRINFQEWLGEKAYEAFKKQKEK